MYFCSTSGRRYLPTASPREATADAKRMAMRAEHRRDRKRGLRLGPPLRWPDGSLGARLPSTAVEIPEKLVMPSTGTRVMVGT